MCHYIFSHIVAAKYLDIVCGLDLNGVGVHIRCLCEASNCQNYRWHLGDLLCPSTTCCNTGHKKTAPIMKHRV